MALAFLAKSNIQHCTANAAHHVRRPLSLRWIVQSHPLHRRERTGTCSLCGKVPRFIPLLQFDPWSRVLESIFRHVACVEPKKQLLDFLSNESTKLFLDFRSSESPEPKKLIGVSWGRTCIIEDSDPKNQTF